jgi:hypothetical protein
MAATWGPYDHHSGVLAGGWYTAAAFHHKAHAHLGGDPQHTLYAFVVCYTFLQVGIAELDEQCVPANNHSEGSLPPCLISLAKPHRVLTHHTSQQQGLLRQQQSRTESGDVTPIDFVARLGSAHSGLDFR